MALAGNWLKNVGESATFVRVSLVSRGIGRMWSGAASGSKDFMETMDAFTPCSSSG